MDNKQKGNLGEKIATEFLIKNKFKILETNFHYSKIAEIDIIAEKNNILHFVEVKTRTSSFFGSPIEAVSTKKLSSIFSCANFYIQKSKKRYSKFQIDVVGIILKKNNPPEITFLEDISI